MKTIGKVVLSKVITILLVLGLVAGGLYWFRGNIMAVFNGTNEAEYSFVIKRFEKENKLVVAGADVETTGKQHFSNDAMKNWPEWTKAVAKFFVSREMIVKVPVKTEFKLELAGLGKEDIHIENGVLAFKRPLTVYVDSQQEGDITIDKASNGLVDKAVDVWTAGAKAQKFLSEKSQGALYETSQKLLSDKAKKKKVAGFAEESLENLINLGAEKELDVQIKVTDLTFVNQDKKAKK